MENNTSESMVEKAEQVVLTPDEQKSAEQLVEKLEQETHTLSADTNKKINEANINGLKLPEKKISVWGKINNILNSAFASEEDKNKALRKEKMIAEARAQVKPEDLTEFDIGIEKWGLAGFKIQDGKAVDARMADPMKDPRVIEQYNIAVKNEDGDLYKKGLKEYGFGKFVIVDHKLIQRAVASTQNGG